MKRRLSISLALVLVLICMFSLTSCFATDGPGINEGYKSFNNGAISFDYPETWLNIPFVKEFAGMNMIMDLEGSGNNINVNSIPKTDEFEKIEDADAFLEQIAPEIESSGMTVKDGKLEKGTTNGLDYVMVSFSSTQSDLPMYQSIIFTTVGEYTYLITVTEVQPDSVYVETIISTLSAVE